ncbi:MAG: DUF5615 family PIN-like protein [Candidatus Latescibacteria bacterium]|nr:DUF5615 family PIN-like protein [Candidatus Latescibacterota bacterium]
MKIKLYLDENIQIALADALRRNGVDALTAEEAGKRSVPDPKHLEYATREERTIFTYNPGHFAKLHSMCDAEGRTHCGIIVSTQLSIGEALRRILKLLSQLTAEDMVKRLE